MDPLRDPRGILLALDHYALDSNVDGNDQWVVDLVKAKNVRAVWLFTWEFQTWPSSLTQPLFSLSIDSCFISRSVNKSGVHMRALGPPELGLFLRTCSVSPQ